MRLGMSLPFVGTDGSPLGPGDLTAAARRIESTGYSSAWVFDAIGRGFLLPDPLTALAAAAAVTTDIEVGTGILQLPLRQPFELAQRIATTQLIAGERLLLGIGVGSTEVDFAIAGVRFEDRWSTFEQNLAALRRLFDGEELDGHRLDAWPSVSGGPPMLIGSWAGPKAIERAATEFNGWVASGAKSSWTALETGIRRFRDAGGERAVVTNVAVDLRATPAASPDPSGPFDLRCPPDVARDRLRWLEDLGYDDVVIVLPHQTDGALAEVRALLT